MSEPVQQGGVNSGTPSVGGIGSQPGAGGATPQPGAGQASVPSQGFGAMLESRLASAGTPAVPAVGAGQAAGLPAQVPAGQAAGAPAAEPVQTAEQRELAELRARLAELPGQDELRAMRELSGWALQEQRRQAQLASGQQRPAADTAAQSSSPGPGSPHPVTGVVPFSDADRAWLTQDSEGRITALPGAPADILHRYHAHQRTSLEFFRKFSADPTQFGFLTQAEAERLAERKFQELSQGIQQQRTAEQIISANKEWMYEKDPAKPDGVARDFYGNPRATKMGNMYLGFVEQLWNGGKTHYSIDQIDRFAQAMVREHVLTERFLTPAQQAQAAAQQQPAGATATTVQSKTPEQLQAEAQAALLNRAAAAAAAGPMTPALAGSATPANPAGPRLSFQDILARNAARQGITL